MVLAPEAFDHAVLIADNSTPPHHILGIDAIRFVGGRERLGESSGLRIAALLASSGCGKAPHALWRESGKDRV
jgi:hypothetical protein